MSRIELGGFGLPIPLPEDGLEALTSDPSNLSPLVYNLPDGTIFHQADYSAFGYTHFEVVCIGAAGGAGGASLGMPSMGRPGPKEGFGGSGGGGGLHVVDGLLTDLPDDVLVAVGKVGLDGTYGDTVTQYNVVKVSGSVIHFDSGIGHSPPYSDNGIPIAPYLSPGLPPGEVASGSVYIPNAYYGAGLDGGDGSASKFGVIAMASGGKGGKKGIQITHGSGDPGGKGGLGGQGGIGGSDVAGGGGLGGSDGLAGQDGTWDGAIGQGGGGGRGGDVMELAAAGGSTSSYRSYDLHITAIAGDSGERIV